jgi:hypothetical protein
MPRIPKTVEPALNAFENVATNKHSPSADKDRTVRTLKKRLDALGKRNKRWSIILTLLATGSIAAASYYYGGPLSAKLLNAGKDVSTIVKTNTSAAARSLRNMAARYKKVANTVPVKAPTPARSLGRKGLIGPHDVKPYAAAKKLSGYGKKALNLGKEFVGWAHDGYKQLTVAR